MSQLAEKWTDGTLVRDFPDHVKVKKTAAADAARFETTCAVVIVPGLKFGDVPVAGATVEHAKIVMANLHGPDACA